MDLSLGTVRTVQTSTRFNTMKDAFLDNPFAIAVTNDGDLCVTEFETDCVAIVADRAHVIKVELIRKIGLLPPAALAMLHAMRRF